MKRQLTFLAALFLCRHFAFASTAATQPAAPWYQFGKNHEIYFAATYQGRSGWFIFDTGCSGSVLDRASFANLRPLGLGDTSQTLSGPMQSNYFEPPDLDIGPVHLRDTSAVILVDCAGLSAVNGRNILGLLGANSFANFAVQIDFDRRSLQFLSNDNPRADHPNWGTAFPMFFDKNLPAIKAKIAGHDVTLALDTGNDGELLMPTSQFDQALGETHANTVSSLIRTAQGDMVTREARLPSFVLGIMQYANLLLNEDQFPVCLVGTGFLSRHVVTIDFRGNTLYLKPGKEFARHSESDMSGLHILGQGNEIVMMRVDSGSPAFNVGARPGDILLAVNGNSVTRTDLDDVRALLRSNDGLKVTITYRQGDQTRSAMFALKRRI